MLLLWNTKRVNTNIMLSWSCCIWIQYITARDPPQSSKVPYFARIRKKQSMNTILQWHSDTSRDTSIPQNMFRALVLRNNRVVFHRRYFCNERKRNSVFQDFSTFAAAHKDTLSLAGGLITVGSIGAYIMLNISVLHRDLSDINEKMDSNIRRIEDKMENNMREIRQYIFASRLADNANTSAGPSVRK